MHGSSHRSASFTSRVAAHPPPSAALPPSPPPPAAARVARRRRARRPDHVHLRIRSSNVVVVVPPSAVRHRPPRTALARPLATGPSLSTTTMSGGSDTSDPASLEHSQEELPPLWLCEAYASRGLCAAGALCPDVHAVITPSMPRLHPHVRCASENVASPRLGRAGEWHAIAAGNEKEATMQVEASECLLTDAAARLMSSVPRPDAPSLCAHFVKKGVCNFGAQCRFVHPLSQPLPLGSGSTGIQPLVLEAEEPAVATTTTPSPVTVRTVASVVAPSPDREFGLQHDPYSASPGWARVPVAPRNA